MGLRSLPIVVLVAHAVALVTACGTPAGVPPDTGPATHDAGAEPVTLWGALSRRDTGDPLPATRVCVLGSSQCVETDATGLFTLENAPPNSEIQLELGGDTPGLVPLVTDIVTHDVSDNLGGWAVTDDATNDAFVAAAMQSWDRATTGVVTVDVHTGGTLLPYGWSPNGLEHATARLEGGPPAIYADASGIPDPSLTETSSSGLAIFVGVPAGDYVLTVTHPGSACVIDDADGWPSGSGDALRVHVVAGAQLDAGFLHCAPTTTP